MKKRIVLFLICLAIAASCCALFGCSEEETHTQYTAYTFVLCSDGYLELRVERPQDIDYSSDLVLPESSYYYKNSEGEETTDHAEKKAVKYIAAGAFKNNVSLTSVTLPQYTVAVPDSCFEGCTKLTTVTCSGQINSIGKNAFMGCSSLVSFSCAEGAVVTEIGENAFNTCIKLKTLYFAFGEGTSIGAGAFYYDSNIPVLNLTKCSYVGAHAFKGCPNVSQFTIPDERSGWAENWNA